MANVQILVDSAADLSAEATEALGIHVVPWSVHVDGEHFLDNPAFRSAEYYRRTARSRATLDVYPPSAQQFAAVLDRCVRMGGQVVAVLSAERITQAVQIARRVRAEYMGRCDVHIVDSQFVSCVQGQMAMEAAQQAQAGMDAVEIVRHLNAMIARSYWAFTVESGEQLVRHSLVENTASVLGSPTGYRPLLLLEEGIISPLQRSRRRGEPVERLVEFVMEFSRLDRLWIVSTGLHPGRQALEDRMKELAPGQAFIDHVYGPVVASYFGPTLLGVAAIESS
ncbi:MAG: DegV family EDD domain-containing protein [Chloroflexi bacterium]|nr:DegV family EDD domain-containing protein [Chloroflexota bacterium]